LMEDGFSHQVSVKLSANAQNSARNAVSKWTKNGVPRLLCEGFAGSEVVIGWGFSLDIEKNVLYKRRAREGCETLKGKKRRVLSGESVFK
jgi:hypothetical protein